MKIIKIKIECLTHFLRHQLLIKLKFYKKFKICKIEKFNRSNKVITKTLIAKGKNFRKYTIIVAKSSKLNKRKIRTKINI